MATRTIANAGGNWNVIGTWVEGAVPTSADAVVATVTSGNLTINATGAICASIDFTNYGTHTFAFGANNWTCAGNVTLISTMIITGTGKLILSGSCTFTSATKTFPGSLQTNTTSTLTLSDDMNLTGSINPSGTSTTLTIGGNFNIYANGYSTGVGTILTRTGTATITFTGGNVSCTSVASLIKIPTIFNSGGTITLGAIFALNTTFTYTAGTITITGNTTTFQNCTINSAGMNWNNVIIDAGSTLTSALYANGSLTTTNSSNITMGGSYGFNVATLTNGLNTNGRQFGLSAGVTYTVRSSFLNPNGTAAVLIKFVSLTPGSKAILTLNQGATQDIPFLGATDIDSSNGQTVWPYKGTITTSLNWQTMPLYPKNIASTF